MMHPSLLFDPGISIGPAIAGAVAYRNGNNSLAAGQFAAVAEQAKINGKIGIEMHARRWEGNALLWAGRTAEALQVLLPVAANRNPQVEALAIFGAMTDLVMLHLFHGSVARIEALMAEARAYLEAVGCERWGHRLLLHLAIKGCNRGEFIEARTLALSALETRDRCTDGPQYAEFSHLRWILRPAFYAGDLAGVEEALSMAERYSRFCVLDEQVWHWMHLQVHRLRRGCGRASGPLEEHTLAAARIEATADPKEPIFDVCRGLILCNRHAEADALSWRTAGNWPFERALFGCDLELNRTLAALGFPPVDVDLEAPLPRMTGLGCDTAHGAAVLTAGQTLRACATCEAGRFASDYPLVRAERRFAWERTLFPQACGHP